MKRKNAILLLIGVFIGTSFWGYLGYGRTKANNYITMLASVEEISPRFGFSDDVKVEKIIKQTPATLIILVKWGEDERLYLTVNKWMRKGFEKMKADVVDKSKSSKMRE